MAFSTNTPIFIFLLLLIFINLQLSALSSPQVPCLFIFGDSLVDNGNNNQLNTIAKANYFPYGIDFPEGPTGRFTNGRNPTDFIAEFLGFRSYIRPFATAQGQDIMTGVNYASGSAGIRTETGDQLGFRYSIDKQLENHNITISRITKLMGNDATAKQLLSKCVYYFVVGSNDYINNYYIPEYYSSSKTYTIEQYATVLIEQYSQQLKTLYNMGAKKIAVSGLSKLGCIPHMIQNFGKGSCFEDANNAVKFFNDKLNVLVDDLNGNLTDAKFISVNGMDTSPNELIDLGFQIVAQPCCKVSYKNGMCIPLQAPCDNRDLHVYYDNFHPTEIVAKIMAAAAFSTIHKLI